MPKKTAPFNTTTSTTSSSSSVFEQLCQRIVSEVSKPEHVADLPPHIDVSRMSQSASLTLAEDLALPASSHFNTIRADCSILPLAKKLQELERLRGETLQYLKSFVEREHAPPQLRWIWEHKLLEPISMQYHAYMKILGMMEERAKSQGTAEKSTPLQQAWALYHELSVDTNKWTLDSPTTHTLAYYLASLVLQDTKQQAPAFDGEIAHNLLINMRNVTKYAHTEKDLKRFEQDLRSGWREQDLTHILLVCARYMPNAVQWTWDKYDKEMGEVLTACNERWQGPTELAMCLQNVCRLRAYAQTAVAGTLEYVAHVLGVYAVDEDELNTFRNQQSLGHFAADFPRMLSSSAWVPKFALCPMISAKWFVCGRGKSAPATCGYLTLALQRDTENFKLSIAEPKGMQVILDKTETDPRNSDVHNAIIASSNHALLELGALMISSEMAFLLHNAQHIERFLKIKVNTFDATASKNNFGNLSKNLVALTQQEEKGGADDFETVHALQSCFDLILRKCADFGGVATKKLSAPLTVVGWQVRGPSRGGDLDVDALPSADSVLHHNLSEPGLLPRKSAQVGTKVHPQKQRELSGVHILAMDDNSDTNTYAKITRKLMCERVADGALAAKNSSTLLHESIGCMALSESPIHHVQRLREQLEWDQLFEDSRYSHTALAKDGSAVYKDRCHFVRTPTAAVGAKHVKCGRGTKAGVTAHFVRVCDQLHVAALPDASGKTCVHALSSRPLNRAALEKMTQRWAAAPSSSAKLASVERSLRLLAGDDPTTMPPAHARRSEKPLRESRIGDLFESSSLPFVGSVYTDERKNLAMLAVHVPGDPEERMDFVLFQV